MIRLKEQAKRLPVQPFYLSNSEEVNIKWANVFTPQMDTLGNRYGVPDDLIVKIKANNAVLQVIGSYEALLGNWQAQWRDTKNSLMYLTSSPVPIGLPAVPERFPDLPTAVTANVFGPFIQAATIILANPDLTEADRNSLGLVKAEGKPLPPEAKKREKASQFNYPVIKAEVKNGVVSLRIVRGSKFMGKAVLLQVDKEGKGVFTSLVITTAAVVTDNISLPSDIVTASWTYRGIYVEGKVQLSDWSPNLYVSVTNEAPIPPTEVEPTGKSALDAITDEQLVEPLAT